MDVKDVLSSFAESFLLGIAPLLVALLVPILIGWARKAWNDARESAPDMVKALEAVAPIFVQAAEQAKASAFIDDKMAYAISRATDWLADRGYKIDIEAVRAVLEAAVYSEFNRYRGSVAAINANYQDDDQTESPVGEG